ncbi:glucose-6-phosphate 1-dehydrogenase-like [Paramacrobiotus metropolitanus]|uniref:glucose-6-phosphate 1-dehydrogenase-like n=1 Tax=Paramacrobiotus metropolitanus TaxID=2943436 RepID=UPI002445FC64|nr:glucose-6-phosphate 1-dehydrogenase-like [Paramacrobiotus metropolitanus]
MLRSTICCIKSTSGLSPSTEPLRPAAQQNQSPISAQPILPEEPINSVLSAAKTAFPDHLPDIIASATMSSQKSEADLKNAKGEKKSMTGLPKEPWQEDQLYTIVIFGASGDLAKKKIYPTLWALYRDELLPKNTWIIGYARSKLSVEDLQKSFEGNCKLQSGDKQKFGEFMKSNLYIAGSYDQPDDYRKLHKTLEEKETQFKQGNRAFYLSLPPFVFDTATTHIRHDCWGTRGWNRVVLEKPFGRDLESSRKLADHLKKLYREEEIYRIDHYLGKELVQNLITLRFANRIFSPAWNNQNIAHVQISFKEPIGTQGRGGYFDEYGIIRDIIQNHLMQVFCLAAMEKPVSLNAEDIRDEKVRVLRRIQPVKLEDAVLGQYVADPEGKGEAKTGYLDDETVPKGSVTPTYAAVLLKIDNERWEGVPFVLRAGKALNERKAEVRVQFKNPDGDIFEDGEVKRDELVMRIQPNEAIYLKMMTKTPNSNFGIEETELDLTYSKRYEGLVLAEAYQLLFIEILRGRQMHFVRNDELEETWRIFTPLLHQIEREKIKPTEYKFGSRGPPEADKLAAKNNYVYSGTYVWPGDSPKK